MKVKCLKYGFCVLIACCLLSCTSRHHSRQLFSPNAFYYGELCSRSVQGHLVLTLRKSGVAVNYFGDHILVVIPSRLLFKSHSSQLRSDSHSLLKLVAHLLACYQKMSVEVIGYNSELSSRKACHSLSSLQAEQVAHVLWRYPIDGRLIAAKGRGAVTQYNELGNCRIEIYTKKLP